jgi:hypothetical protein
MFRRLRSAIFREFKVILPKLCVRYVISTEYVKVGSGYRPALSVGTFDCSTRRYPLPTAWQDQTVSNPYLHIFGTYGIAYTQFRQNHFGLPEDGAPEVLKHVEAS